MHKLPYVFIDTVFFIISIFLALFIASEGIISVQYLNVFFNTAFVITAVNILICIVFGIYKSIWQYASVREMVKIVTAIFTCTVVMYLYRFIFNILYPQSFYTTFIVIAVTLIGGSRLLIKISGGKAYRFKRDEKTIRTLIIGAGKAGSMLIKELKSHPELKLLPIAIIDDDIWKHYSEIDGIPVIGDRSIIPAIVEKYKIEEIIIAIPSAGKNSYLEILKICRGTQCRLKTLPGVFEIINGQVTVNHIRDINIDDLLGRNQISLDIEKIAGYLHKEVVLVTGGGGSIGSELCRQIMKFEPQKLIIFDIFENNAYDLQNELHRVYGNRISLEVLIGSVRDKERLRQIFSNYRPGVVFHAAAHKHVPLMEANPAEAIKNNVFGTLFTAQCADEFGTGKFVLISTDKAVNPTNIMGATKRLAEMIIQSLDKISNTEFTAVRFGNVLGSNGSVIPLFKRQIAQGGPVTITHPDIERYFMTIPEAAQLVIQAGAMAQGGEIFVLDMGKPVKIVDLAEDLIRLSGFVPGKDIKLEFIGLRPGEKLYEELLTNEEELNKTSSDKIFIVKPLELSYDEVLHYIENLELYMMDTDVLKDYISRIIPTYRYLQIK